MSASKIVVVANGERKATATPCSVAEFVIQCGWRPTQVVIERNGQVLQRTKLHDVQLQDGDKLEIIVPVAGG